MHLVAAKAMALFH